MVMMIDWAIMVFMPFVDGNRFGLQKMDDKVKGTSSKCHLVLERHLE
jgi:hypothetical protein